jgi:hypothetical protein
MQKMNLGKVSVIGGCAYLVAALGLGSTSAFALSIGLRPLPQGSSTVVTVAVKKPKNVSPHKPNSVKKADVDVKHKKTTNIDVNHKKHTDVNVYVRHHDHGWHGTYWGAVAFGVTLGTVITVAANTPPPPPDPSVCWTWTNSAQTKGYWYYCSGP